jgi:hypothetical protein
MAGARIAVSVSEHTATQMCTFAGYCEKTFRVMTEIDIVIREIGIGPQGEGRKGTYEDLFG